MAEELWGKKDGGQLSVVHNRRAKRRFHRDFVKTGNLAQATGHAGKLAGCTQMWVAMATAEPGTMDQHGRLHLQTHTRMQTAECGFVHLIYLHVQHQGAN